MPGPELVADFVVGTDAEETHSLVQTDAGSVWECDGCVCVPEPLMTQAAEKGSVDCLANAVSSIVGMHVYGDLD